MLWRDSTTIPLQLPSINLTALPLGDFQLYDRTCVSLHQLRILHLIPSFRLSMSELGQFGCIDFHSFSHHPLQHRLVPAARAITTFSSSILSLSLYCLDTLTHHPPTTHLPTPTYLQHTYGCHLLITHPST